MVLDTGLDVGRTDTSTVTTGLRRRFLRECIRDRSLRPMFCAALGHRSGSLRDEDLLRACERAIAAGRMRIAFAHARGDVPFAEAALEPEAISTERAIGVHWIEIELLDMAGKPIAGVAYEVRLPNGAKLTGRLDDEGRARVDGIPEYGECRVGFPELDGEAWERVA
jgi:hypothetical protein